MFPGVTVLICRAKKCLSSKKCSVFCKVLLLLVIRDFFLFYCLILINVSGLSQVDIDQLLLFVFDIIEQPSRWALHSPVISVLSRIIVLAHFFS